MQTIPDISPLKRRFVPADFAAEDKEAVAALYKSLGERELTDLASLHSLIEDWEELNAILDELYNASYVAMTCDTRDEAAEARYLRVVEEIVPLYEQSNFDLQRKLLAAPAVDELEGDLYDVFLRQIRAQVELFREENIPLLTEVRKLEQEYEKIIGNQMVDFMGERRTMQQMVVFLEETDRELREAAWRARHAVQAADYARLDELFDNMMVVRRKIAANADKSDYREYMFASLLRFDYTPEDCLAFHDAIEHEVVPAVREFNRRRQELLGLDSLRPWDTQVDPDGSEPLRPFQTVDELIDGCRRIFGQVDPELSAFYDAMISERLLDLGSREGKAPGGYMTSLNERRVPFIFMNAVGLKRDVDTLLHEGGHAFHYFLARELPLKAYHGTGSEFSEVASQAMEYLARPYLGEFYAPADLARLKDDQLRSGISFLPFMAMLDAFQHWVYTTDESGADARRAKWAELEARFRPDTDWSDLEQARDYGWQYPHVFSVPFYYVEYGIALLAALRVWLNSLEDERGAVDAYKHALSLGGSRPLPDLFAAAGARFSMDDKTVREIVSGTVAQIGSK